MRWILTTLAAMWVFAAPSGALAERPTDPTGVAGAYTADPSCASACPVRVTTPVHQSVRSLPPFTVAACAPASPPRARAWQVPDAVGRPILQARRAPVSSRGPPLV